MHSLKPIQHNSYGTKINTPPKPDKKSKEQSPKSLFNPADAEDITKLKLQCYTPSQLPKRDSSDRGVGNPYNGFGLNKKTNTTISFHHIIALDKFNTIIIDFFKTADIQQKKQFIENIMAHIDNNSLLFKNHTEMVESLKILYSNLDSHAESSLNKQQQKSLNNLFGYLYFNGFAGPDEQTRFPALKAYSNFDRLAREFIPKIQYQLLSRLNKSHDYTEKVGLLLELSKCSPDSIKYNEGLWSAVTVGKDMYQSTRDLLEPHEKLSRQIALNGQDGITNNLVTYKEEKKQLSTDLKDELAVFNNWKNLNKTTKGMENQITTWIGTVNDMKAETSNKFMRLILVDKRIKDLLDMQTEINLRTTYSSPVRFFNKIMNESPYEAYGTKNISEAHLNLQPVKKNLNNGSHHDNQTQDLRGFPVLKNIL